VPEQLRLPSDEFVVLATDQGRREIGVLQEGEFGTTRVASELTKPGWVGAAFGKLFDIRRRNPDNQCSFGDKLGVDQAIQATRMLGPRVLHRPFQPRH